MKSTLAIISPYLDIDGEVRSLLYSTETETNLNPPPLYPQPKCFTGKITNISVAGTQCPISVIERFKYLPDTRIEFLGKAFRFTRLELDGSFTAEATLF